MLDRTCVLLYSSEGLLQGVSSGGALGGVGRQAVGVHSLHGRMSVGLMRNAGESVDDGRDNAGNGGRDVGRWRTEACWEKSFAVTTHAAASTKQLERIKTLNQCTHPFLFYLYTEATQAWTLV